MYAPIIFEDDAYADEVVRQQYLISWGKEPPRDQLAYPVYVTPFPGTYEGKAGYVVTIKGSPPKMIAIVTNDYWEGPTVYLLGASEFEAVTWEGPVRYLRLRSAILALIGKAKMEEARAIQHMRRQWE